MSDVTDQLAALAAGKTTLAKVAEEFASRTWPTPPRTGLGDDPEPVMPGSWGEVEAAYACGQIDHEQYTALFNARAEASGTGGRKRR